jgi:hypothetical protein
MPSHDASGNRRLVAPSFRNARTASRLTPYARSTFRISLQEFNIGGAAGAASKQAVDYAANQGTDWVLLTNGETWRAYRLTFGKPVTSELVLEIHFSQLQPRRDADLELLYHLTREGWTKSAIDDFHTQRQALSRCA